METYEEGYESDEFLPHYDLQAFDEVPNYFSEALLGGDESPIPEITQLIPESNSDSVGNQTIV